MFSNGAVACGAQTTAAAAERILALGGNAVDAVVAAAFASCVTEPGVSSLGGGGFLLHRDPDGGRRLFDFFTSVPSGTGQPPESVTLDYAGATQDFRIGFGSVAVPGCLDGLLCAQAMLGRLPLPDVLEPAIEYARDGFVIQAAPAHAMGLIAKVLQFSWEGRRINTEDGRPMTTGDLFRQPELAGFLVAVAEGEVTGARDLAHEFGLISQGCPVSGRDLREYRVIEREPLVRPIRGGMLSTNPLPSLGGTIVAHVLDDLADRAHPEPVEIAEALVETTMWLKAKVSGRGYSTGTSHVSALDTDGGCAALTLSNGVGSGVYLPGTGIHLNNMMGEDDLHPEGPDLAVPGERIHSMMAPSIVEFSHGVLVLGTGGSERIRSALTRVITLLLSGDADLEHAVSAPRIHVDNAGDIQVEPGLPAEQVAALSRLGPVREWSTEHFYFGGVNAVYGRSDGSVKACADPRRGGATAIV